MRHLIHVSVFTFLFLGWPGPALAQDDPGESKASLRAIVATLGADLSRLPSKESALIVGVGAALALAIHPVDQRVTRGAAGSPLLDATFEIGEHAGSGWVQAGGAVGTLLVGHAIGSPRIRSVGVDLVRAQVVTTVLTQGIKRSVGRTRPDGGRHSFPSGHTSTTFASAAVLERHFGWKAAIPAYAVAGYVAASRLQENKHYASDVIFGAALGLVAGRTVTIGRGPARFAISPLMVSGGVEVTLSHR